MLNTRDAAMIALWFGLGLTVDPWWLAGLVVVWWMAE